MSILALDFDGVLHPSPNRHEAPFGRLELLEEWLRTRPDVSVLVSSSWREAYTLQEIRELFSEDLQRRVVDVTPMVRSSSYQRQWRWSSGDMKVASSYERQFEIELWVAENVSDHGNLWLALDDEPGLFEPGCENLVTCDPEAGLSEAQLDELDATLGLGKHKSEIREPCGYGVIFTKGMAQGATIHSAPELVSDSKQDSWEPVPVSMEPTMLDRLVEVLVAEFAPRAIYLFGSFATGTATSYSDLDLFVVLANGPAGADRYAALRGRRAAEWALGGDGPRVDLQLDGEANFDAERAADGTLQNHVWEFGKAIYTAPD